MEAVSTRIGEGFTLMERIDPRPRLLMFGAGHVGQALFPIAATLPFDLRWHDTRPEFAVTGASIIATIWRRMARDTPPGSFYLIFISKAMISIIALAPRRAGAGRFRLLRRDRLGHQAGPVRKASWQADGIAREAIFLRG